MKQDPSAGVSAAAAAVVLHARNWRQAWHNYRRGGIVRADLMQAERALTRAVDTLRRVEEKGR